MNETAPAKWWQQKSIVITGIIAAAIVAIIAIGSGKSETTAAEAPAPEASAQATPAAPAPAPAPATPAPATTTPAPDPAPATQAPAAPVNVTMPDVVGMNYQDAQDLLRSQGLIVLPATDGTGANRIPILDANWIVTGQDIAAGTTIETGTGVTCTIIKSTDR